MYLGRELLEHPRCPILAYKKKVNGKELSEAELLALDYKPARLPNGRRGLACSRHHACQWTGTSDERSRGRHNKHRAKGKYVYSPCNKKLDQYKVCYEGQDRMAEAVLRWAQPFLLLFSNFKYGKIKGNSIVHKIFPFQTCIINSQMPLFKLVIYCI